MPLAEPDILFKTIENGQNKTGKFYIIQLCRTWTV